MRTENYPWRIDLSNMEVISVPMRGIGERWARKGGEGELRTARVGNFFENFAVKGALTNGE